MTADSRPPTADRRQPALLALVLVAQYLYTDGGIYEGEWLDGKMHGRGLYTFPNGNKYDGEWQNDVKEGYGVLQVCRSSKEMWRVAGREGRGGG